MIRILKRNEIENLKQYDNETLERVFKYYFSYMTNYIKKMFPVNKEDAEWLALGAFTEATYIKIDKYDPDKMNFVSWLILNMCNYCINIFRKFYHKNIEYIDNIEDKSKSLFIIGLYDDLKRVINNEEEYIFYIKHKICGESIELIAKEHQVNYYVAFRKVKRAEEKVEQNKEIFLNF